MEAMVAIMVAAIIAALTYLTAQVDKLIFGTALIVFIGSMELLAAYCLAKTFNSKEG